MSEAETAGYATRADIADLKADHGRLEGKIDSIRGEIKGLDTGIRGEIKGLDTGIRGEIKGLNTGFSVVKWCLIGVMAPIAIAVLGGVVAVSLRLFGAV